MTQISEYTKTDRLGQVKKSFFYENINLKYFVNDSHNKEYNSCEKMVLQTLRYRITSPEDTQAWKIIDHTNACIVEV